MTENVLLTLEDIHRFYSKMPGIRVEFLSLKYSSPSWSENLALIIFILGFPGGLDSEEPACNAGNPGSIPGSGKSPGEWNGNPL